MTLGERIYAKSSSLIAKVIRDQVVVVPMKAKGADLGRVYTIKGVGKRIWELINGKRSVAEIRGMITKEFAVSPQAAEKDLRGFLKILENKKIIN